MNTDSIPARKDVPAADQWNLATLFADEDAWEAGLRAFEARLPEIESFRGTLGRSAETLTACLEFMNEIGQLQERLGYYAQLRLAEDAGNSDSQGRFARFMGVATRAEALASYQTPEIQAIPDAVMAGFLAQASLKPFAIALRKILRFKPHVLSESEEKLLALQAEAAQTAQKTFAALTDVDLDFGRIETPEGPKPLSQSSFAVFMLDPDRKIRKTAYRQFYEGFDRHKNTLAALYNGSVQLDIYQARVRHYPSARAMSLFPDRVPETVYDNLVETVNQNLPVLHRYYALRRRVLGVATLRPWDVYVPLVAHIQVKHTFEQAVDLVVRALAPLGEAYCRTLSDGLTGSWVDRYENRGKRSGAFSAGSYAGDPYILMNYKADVLRDVFTLAHEGGHSMHSWYSVRHNPFQHYDYTIFEAEVASTFNEQLLARYLIDRAETDDMRAYLVGKLVDDTIATIFRQTMFAEFEHKTHAMAEANTPLTVDSLRSEYGSLLKKYFGPGLALEAVSDLEGLRIPHFYRAFYVYKYATGLSAAIALANRVLAGGPAEQQAYLAFLRSGGSRYPLESLALAGVDMSRPEPVQAALSRFAELVARLEELL